MGKSGPFNYFEAYMVQAHYAEEMALNMVSAFHAGELGTRELMLALHVVEGDADEANHSIQAHLLQDFVVPLERSSMAALAHALDDVCDAIEQIAIDAYMRRFENHASGIPSDIASLLCCLKNGVVSLCGAVELLRDMDARKTDIKSLCVNAQDCEAQADELYIEAVRQLYENVDMGDRECRIYHEMLDTLENAMDSIENAAELLELVVAQNV